MNYINSNKKITMNTLEKFFRDSNSPSEYVKNYLSYISNLLEKLESDEIEKVVNIFLKARQNGNRIFFIGNGGSAATASHFANDLAIGTRSNSNPFAVMSLTDNNAVITAIANDYGYEYIYVKQLEALYSKGDILVAISASGNSPNLLRAINFVKKFSGLTVGLTGFDGGKLKEIADHTIHVPTVKGEYGPVEDIHMIFDHIIGTYLMYTCRSEN